MQKKYHSMRWKMVGILLACWLIPFLFLIGVLGVYIGSSHSEKTALNYQEQLVFNNRICTERLNHAVSESRQASYDGTVLKVRKAYLNGDTSHVEAVKQYTEYMNARYQQQAVSGAVLWLGEDSRQQSVSIYNEKANGSYQQIRHYWDEDHEAVAAYADTLDTRVGFLIRDEAVYLIRNLVDSRYKTQGTLVLLLNQAYCFDSVLQYPMQEGACIWIDGTGLILTPNEEVRTWDELYDEMAQRQYKWISGQLCVTDAVKGDSYQLYTAMMIQKSVTMFPFYGYQYVMAAMLCSLFPLLAAVLFAFRREVTWPVQALLDGAKRMEDDELGYQITYPAHNLEFRYLTDAFNRMSSHMKQQFDRIYQEEIALREARIMALQSHINPHFMNNTMEIINWEARLAGNTRVSRMIEALSNMMDAAMDRRKRPEVRLAEEMGYVNSYLYIMKERLGRRLTVETDIPEELMDCPVPRLILQPLIENAIEHGVVPNGSGTVTIRGWQDGAYLYLETLNDGGMTQEDRDRIERLLDINYNTSKEPAGNLGIANVNQRLRILFGEPCGLTIREWEGQVSARLTIPLRDMQDTHAASGQQD